MRSALLLLTGILLGVTGYAAYRGDLGWLRPDSQPAAEKPDEQLKAMPSASRSFPSQLPDLPISLAFHENRSGRGYIVQVHNTSQRHLAVLVELRNATLNEYRAAPLELDPGELREIGQAQGWSIASGETINIRQDGYRPSSLTVP
jgi:hypothetical protein